MAYPNAFVKLTVSGTVAGEDIWSNSYSISTQDGSSGEEMFADLNPAALATAAQAFYCQGGQSMMTYNRLSTIKLALIGTDGKTIGEPKIYDYPNPPAGQATFTVPPQDSIVISLLTDTIRGLANRGRIYAPAGFGDVTSSSGRLNATTVTFLVNKAVTWINAINTFAQTASPAGIVVINSAVRAGASHPVTGVEVGNLVDTQRRRRNRLSEAYTTAPLVTP